MLRGVERAKGGRGQTSGIKEIPCGKPIFPSLPKEEGNFWNAFNVSYDLSQINGVLIKVEEGIVRLFEREDII